MSTTSGIAKMNLMIARNSIDRIEGQLKKLESVVKMYYQEEPNAPRLQQLMLPRDMWIAQIRNNLQNLIAMITQIAPVQQQFSELATAYTNLSRLQGSVIGVSEMLQLKSEITILKNVLSNLKEVLA